MHHICGEAWEYSNAIFNWGLTIKEWTERVDRVRHEQQSFFNKQVGAVAVEGFWLNHIYTSPPPRWHDILHLFETTSISLLYRENGVMNGVNINMISWMQDWSTCKISLLQQITWTKSTIFFANNQTLVSLIRLSLIQFATENNWLVRW